MTLGPLLSAYGAVASLRGVPGPERRRAVGCLQAILAAWVDGVGVPVGRPLPRPLASQKAHLWWGLFLRWKGEGLHIPVDSCGRSVLGGI